MTPLWMQNIFTIILLAGALFLYVQPMIYAKRHEHPQRRAITMLNVFAGWTFIGWVVAMVWAHTHVKRTTPVNPHIP